MDLTGPLQTAAASPHSAQYYRTVPEKPLATDRQIVFIVVRTVLASFLLSEWDQDQFLSALNETRPLQTAAARSKANGLSSQRTVLTGL